MASMRALVFGNRDDDDLGLVGEWAEPIGFTIDRRAREDDSAPVNLERYDLVVSLGSVWSVYWPRVAHRLAPELDALRTAVARGMPVLGICFGGQMLSAALGGEVTLAPRPEIGWLEIDTDAPDVIPAGPWMQWHIDRFTVPPGATELARTELATQAFTVRRALGLQFHPEVDTAIVKRWVAESEGQLRAEQLRATDVIADSERNESQARFAAFRMLDAFWTTIAAR